MKNGNANNGRRVSCATMDSIEMPSPGIATITMQLTLHLKRMEFVMKMAYLVAVLMQRALVYLYSSLDFCHFNIK